MSHHARSSLCASRRSSRFVEPALIGTRIVTVWTHNILIIEDEPAIRAVLRVMLARQGYKPIEADTGARAQIATRSHKPDLLLMDLGLPDIDGLTVIRSVRAWSPVPIIVLSARAMEEQKVAALDAGADDFVTKPFSEPELLARVRAALRRNARHDAQTLILKLGLLSIDLGRRLCAGPQGAVHLTPLEYRILECLARQTGIVVRQQQILREVWGPYQLDDTRRLRVLMRQLRQKLEPDPHRPQFLITETASGLPALHHRGSAVAPRPRADCATRTGWQNVLNRPEPGCDVDHQNVGTACAHCGCYRAVSK